MVLDERKRNLNIRIADSERAMLVALAEREGLTSSDWLRRVIRVSYAKAFGEKPPKPKRRKR